jgi:hypothetical protein
MSYNGSGTFQINTTGQPVVTGTVISSSAFNALTADLATGLSTAITKDGQTATTVRIPFAQGINSSLTTDTSSGSTGSIYTAGGIGITKGLFVGGTATFSATPIFSALTASSAVATDASKNLVSVTNTGTGNNVLATSPTITTPTINTITSAASTALTLQSNNGTTAVTVDTSQNVLVGATSFAYTAKLNVSGSQYMTGGSIENWAGSYNLYNTTTNYSGIGFYKGTSAITGSTRQAVIECQFDTIFNIKTDTTIPIIFATNSSERMRIDSSGNVLIGTTSTSNPPSQGISLFGNITNSQLAIGHANGTGGGQFYLVFGYNGGTIGGVTQNGTTAVSYNTTSDYRLKENIAPMTGALARIAALKPVTYTWKAAPDEVGEGFIAHELAEVCPQATTGEKDAVETYTDEEGNEATRPKYQGIDTSFLVATLTAAIQEQQALITSLTERIVALEAK